MAIITSETPTKLHLDIYYDYYSETGIFSRKYDGYRGHITDRGYYRIKIEGKHYMVHRLIWKKQTGEEPKLIDHKDGNTLNNKWDNLRSTTQLLNVRNSSMLKTNTSGHPGIHFNIKNGKWVARISFNNRRLVIGTFYTKEEAIEARQKMIEKYPILQFTKRHYTKNES